MVDYRRKGRKGNRIKIVDLLESFNDPLDVDSSEPSRLLKAIEGYIVEGWLRLMVFLGCVV